MVDRFFQSGYDIRVLLDWVKEITDNLQALNLFTPSTASQYYLETSRDLIEQNRLKTFDIYVASLAIKEKQQLELSRQQSMNQKIATEVVIENVLNQTLLDKFLEADRIAIQQRYDDIIQPDLNTERIRLLVPERNNQTGYSRTYVPKDAAPGTINAATPKFPTHGQAYNNHLNDISNDMISRTEFDVFTGAANPNSPNLTFFKSWTKLKADGKSEFDPSKTFTPDKPYSSYINELIKNSESNIPIGSYKFFIEKLHGRYSTGAPYKKNKVKSTKDQNKIPTELTNRMVFAAYINNYNDSFNVDKSEYNFIGRAEGFPVYKQTKRTLTLEFSIMADFSSEMMVAISEFYRTTQNVTPNNIDDQLEQIVKNFPDWGLGVLPNAQILGDVRAGSHIPGVYSDTPESLWIKMNFLAQCCYPYYRSDGKMKEQPMIRIRIADFYDVTGMVTSFNIDLNELEGIQIDLNPSNIGNIPLGAKVTISLDIYHDFEPSSNFFGFYHRKEFDEGTIDPVTGGGSLGISNERNDTILENVQKNSPANIFNTIKNERLLDTPSILGQQTKTIKNDILNLRKSVGDIVNAGIKIADALLASRTKKAMQAYMRIQKIINVIRIQQGLPANNPLGNVQDGVNLFGNVVPFVNKGNNLITNIKDQITDPKSLINPSVDILKDKYEGLLNNAISAVESVSDGIKNTNNTLNKVGIETGIENQTIEEMENKIEAKKYTQIVSRTIGDIINQIKSKDGPNQETTKDV